MLRLSPELLLKDESMTQTFALLAMRGAGKSNVLVVMAEEMHAAGLHWIAIDPKGDWWGIRSSGDGKGPGLPVPIFGGRHGDVELNPHAGATLAELLVNESMSAVVDISEMTKHEWVSFLAGTGREDGFFGRLYRLKDQGQPPTHVFLEEAHEYLPQSVTNQTAKLHADASRISTMGRQRGLGSTLATQRSARVHKDVLTQTDTLIAMRVTSPQDRKAVKDWIDYNAGSQEIVDSLPSLPDGVGWVVSPNKLGVVRKVRFRRRRTFDSGATPTIKAGKTRKAPRLADIDFAAITKLMGSTLQEMKAKDPKELQKRVRELERELATASRKAEGIQGTVKVERVEVPMLSSQEKAWIEELRKESIAVAHRVTEASERINGRTAQLVGALDGLLAYEPSPPVMAPRVTEAPPMAQRPRRATVARQEGDAPGGGDQLSNYAQELFATFVQRHPMVLTRTKLSIFSGRSRKSSMFAPAVRELLNAGLVKEDGNELSLTELGAADVTSHEAMSPAQLRYFWLDKLPAYEGSLLAVLFEAHGAWLTKEEVSERSGRSLGSSMFAPSLRTLVSHGLAERDGDKYRAADELL